MNGSLCLDENIADNGGLKDAYRAFKKLAFRRASQLKTIKNYTLDQLFFIGFGTVIKQSHTNDFLWKKKSFFFLDVVYNWNWKLFKHDNKIEICTGTISGQWGGF